MSRSIRGVKEREEYWMNRCLEEGVYNADPDPTRPKFFITFPFPYMNGSLHLGHGYTSTRLDVIARYKRLKGYNVLFPWAWHWTGEAVMGICHRIEDGDESVIRRLVELDGVPRDMIDEFRDPVFLVKFFTENGREDVKKLGHSIDWRREFHTSDLHPLYTKFVEWQIRKLYEGGYITQGPYPVVWCPRDESPTGDHDRLVGEGVRPEEYSLIKFKLIDQDLYLVAATFRPETIYGTTNVWLHPDVEYAAVEIEGEKWLISEEAANKLTQQLREVNILYRVKGSEFIGKLVNVPILNRIVPVLPAKFVDPSTATGVVYSVPAHAPYDWLALKDLKDDLDSLDINIRELVKGLHPISIISVEGYGDYPALEICEDMGIVSQMDERAADATHEIYVKEFHTGLMKDKCIGVSGLPVKEAKEAVKRILIDKGLGDSMYDLPDEVICRCGTKCIVKILEDQWSLRYSDEDWKRRAKEAVSRMRFYPPELRSLMNHYIDWYHDWPCTRKTGLGTQFPYGEDWIVETLTDSTVYMAFYIVSKYYNEGSIDPSKVNDAFFDYIYLGKIDKSELNKTGIDTELLRKIREEFMYWYPVDLRGSGKDLISNHLTFFIFHHVAIFPEEYWPKGLAANGFIQLEGEPMSKSSGNFISLKDAIEKYGADALRLTLALGADDLEDPNFKISDIESYRNKIEGIPNFIQALLESVEERDDNHHDRVAISKIYMRLNDIEDALEDLKIALAGRMIFNDLPNIVREYLRLVITPSKKVVDLFIDTWIKLLSMYIPYISQEIWHTILGREGYVFLSKWPKIDSSIISKKDILIERYADSVLDDLKSILKILKGQGRTLKVYISSHWKWKVYELVKEAYIQGSKPNLGEIIRSVSDEHSVVDKKDIAAAVKNIMKLWFSDYAALKEIFTIIRNEEDEKEMMNSYIADYITKRTGLSVEIYYEEEAGPEESYKASRALPLKPAYVIE